MHLHDRGGTLASIFYGYILATLLVCTHVYQCMYHFVWVDQREKQGYKSDVSMKRDTTKLYPGKINFDLNPQLITMFT